MKHKPGKLKITSNENSTIPFSGGISGEGIQQNWFDNNIRYIIIILRTDKPKSAAEYYKQDSGISNSKSNSGFTLENTQQPMAMDTEETFAEYNVIFSGNIPGAPSKIGRAHV